MTTHPTCMKQFLSKLRREAAVFLAKTHPEVRLTDIGLALGISAGRPASIVSGWLTAAGIKRKHGAGAPSFPKDSIHIQPRKLAAHQDEVMEMLKSGASYQVIAERFKVDMSTVGTYATQVLGMRRGYGYYKLHSMKVSDAELETFWRANPKMSNVKIAAALGYRSSGSFAKRLRRLRLWKYKK